MTTDDIVSIAQIADRADYHSGWVGDHVVYPMSTVSRNDSVKGTGTYPPDRMRIPTHESLTTLAYVAGVTTRLKLGVGCMVVPQRQPLVLAKQIVTIDQLSHGRVVFGAVGGWLEEEFAALDAPFTNRGERLEEAIGLMRQCWETDVPSWDGRHWSFPALQFQPKPVQDPLPVWFGGHSLHAFRRAALVGDGWIGVRLLPAEAAPWVQTLRRLRRDSPRSHLPFTIMIAYAPSMSGFESGFTVSKLREVMSQYEEAGVDVLSLDSHLAESRAVRELVEIGAAALA
jgi:probable F420-dependent oxidoreductase